MKTLPAAPEPATPTDLSTEQVQAVAEALNPIIADSFAHYAKTKNSHRHLSGSHFTDYHKLLDDQAGQILETIDPMAERVRRIGGTTIRSVSRVSGPQSIEDDNDKFVHPGEMLRRLMEDNHQTARKVRSAHEVTDERRDYSTSDLLESVLDGAEDLIWYSYETIQGKENPA